MLVDLGLGGPLDSFERERGIRLLTNNPEKVRAVEGPGREVVVRERVGMVPLAWTSGGKEGVRGKEVEKYISTKVSFLCVCVCVRERERGGGNQGQVLTGFDPHRLKSSSTCSALERANMPAAVAHIEGERKRSRAHSYKRKNLQATLGPLLQRRPPISPDPKVFWASQQPHPR